MEVAKEFVRTAHAASSCARTKVLKDLLVVVKEKRLPPEAVKVIVHTLGSSLLRYGDNGGCRLLVRSTLTALCVQYGQPAVNELSTVLCGASKCFDGTTSVPMGKHAVTALQWSCIALRYKSPPSSSLLTSQAIFLAATTSSTKLWGKAVRILSSLWSGRESVMKETTAALLDTTPSPPLLLLLCVLSEYCRKHSMCQQLWEDKKNAVLTYYITAVLSGKDKPLAQIVDHCGVLFSRVNHEVFSAVIMQPASKSLLRSPDEKMCAVSCLMSSLKIDCSRYAMELLKNVAGQLCSTNESTRDNTVQLVQSLSRQCSDTSTCVDMLKLLMSMLKGDGGKLASFEHRLAVLKAVEALSKCPLTSRGQEELASAAVDGLILYLKKESHPATQLTTVGTLAAYCELFYSSVPSTLFQHLKNNLDSSSSYSLRTLYWSCVDGLCHHELTTKLLEFLPAAIAAIERAKPSSSQSAMVEEAIVASWLLLERVSAHPDEIGPALQRVWPVLDSHSFTAERTVSNAPLHVQQTLIKLCQCVLLSSSGTPPVAKPCDWLKVLVDLSTSESWLLRQQATECVRTVVDHTPSHVFDLLEQLLQWNLVDDSDNRNLKALPRLLLVMAISSLGDRREEFAVAVFLLTHHPAVVRVCSGGLWSKLVKQMSLSPPSTLLACCSTIADKLFANVHSNPAACREGIQTVVKLCGSDGVKVIVNKIVSVITKRDILDSVRDDVDIMMTPPTQLWHSELRQQLSQAVEGTGVSANLKRESRAYRYEDQKWDLQMRKELSKRRRLHSGSDDVQSLLKEAKSLTVKQRETITTQLAKEATVREKMTALDHELETVELVMEMVCCYRESVSLLPLLVTPMLSCMTSAVAGGHVINMWNMMSNTVLADKRNASLFHIVSTQVLAPSYPRPSGSVLPLVTYLPLLLKTLSSLPTADPLLFDVTWSMAVGLLETILVTRVSEFEYCAAAALAALSSASSSHCGSQKFGHALFPVAPCLQLLGAVITVHSGPLKGIKPKRLAVDGYMSLVASLTDDEVVSEDVQSVLVAALSNSDALLRHTALRAIDTLTHHVLIDNPAIMAALLVASHDKEDNNNTLATKLWELAGYNVSNEELGPTLLHLLTHPPQDYLPLLRSTAEALGQWLAAHQSRTHSLLQEMQELYKQQREEVPRVERDSVGRIKLSQREDKWEGRMGVARIMSQLGILLPKKKALDLLLYIVPLGLQDPQPLVRENMQQAAVAVITKHGKELTSSLMDHFDQCLSKAGSTQDDDLVRQSVIVLMGTLASHMDHKDSKVKKVTEQLLENLDTPSQQVQQSIAKCLVPLVQSMKGDADEVMKSMIEKLLESPSYAQRRGASYGLAGLVKGLGIPCLKQLGVMATLQEAIKNKKNFRHREGALLAFETLCDMLGRLFEPYVVHLLPDLLLCFGDGNQYVREATDQAARTIMAHLSSHGVKLVLPSLLSALEEDSWRTKAGSAELLGAMAYCAPKQLSSCLPSIVPRLMEVMTDSHSKVQHSGAQALQQIASVIKNPEIQGLVPVLLAALASPSIKSQPCLQALINTEFEHKLGPPSLALIMPTIKRSLESRSTDSKRMAAQLITDMNAATDRKELSPYLTEVLPGLKESLVDPVPEVRTSCAQALGAMVQGMGEEGLKEVLPWLLQTLTSDTASVDRSGAAQGISEVLKAQGIGMLEQLMPTFVSGASDGSSPSYRRDGYLMLFQFLPLSFGEQFVSFIDRILPPLLMGLADQSEYVRETALLAGQTIIIRYASKSVELFLPQLEKGLFDNNWRIRCSSVQLLGDLLFQISGQSGKMSTESAEDDNFGTEEARTAIINTLGADRRNRVLAGLFMGCSDVALLVRQTSVHVWKVVVTTTAKTLREILPTLVSLLLGSLASSSHDRRQVAARTLGDLVRKLGERVLPDLFPMLEEGLHSTDMQERQGVCIGLSEIIQHTSRDYMQMYADSLLPTIRNALCDQEGEVRAAAAHTFQSLHTTVGHRVLDEVLTPLMGQLLEEEEGDEERREVVLDGLRHVMAIKSRVVLPVMIPRLIQPPVNTRALALLSSVAGPALHNHLNRVIPALVSSLEDVQDPEIVLAAEGVVLSVCEEPGLAILIEELFKMGRSDRSSLRVAAVGLLLALCDRSTAPLLDHAPQLIVYTTESLSDKEDEVCVRAWGALKALVTKVIGQKQLPQYTGYLSRGLKLALNSSPGEELNGFNIKGIEPAMLMLKEGLVSGSPDEKEESARVLVDVIQLSSAKTLSSGKVVMAIAGPLIRVLGDRFSWNVKYAVLLALVILIRKVGSAAKAFIPQLQTSYLKALGDPNKPVREQAVVGISELVSLSPRVDPVFNDLLNNIKKNDDSALRNTMLQALCGVLQAAGKRITEKHRGEMRETLVALQSTAQDSNRLEAAKCLGLLCAYLPDDELSALLETHVLVTHTSSEWSVLQSRATTLSSALQSAATRLLSLKLSSSLPSTIAELTTSDRTPVSISGLQCLLEYVNAAHSDDPQILSALTQCLENPSVDVRQTACQVFGEVTDPSDRFVAQVLPTLLNCCRDKNTAVKVGGEEALGSLLHLATPGDNRLKHFASLLDSGNVRKLEESKQKALSRIRR